mmetsp:Transcript_899/g.1484  ORF Transcript_899/g.1484 Transcript_899/m.1484 type:complete len:236 (-) Transcript_899:438-1145(-)
MRCQHIGAADGAHASVGGEHHDGGQRGLQGAVEESEALNIQHVHLINKEHTGHEFGHALVDVTVHHTVDLRTKLFGDFRLLRLGQLAHHGQNILASLGTRIRHIEIMQSHILHDLLLFVHISFWYRHIFIRLQIKFTGIHVRAAHALHGAVVGLDVDHIAHAHFLLLQRLEDRRVQAELLRTLRGLQADHYVTNGASVAAQRVFRLFRCNLSDLSFVHFFAFLDSETNGPSKVFH